MKRYDQAVMRLGRLNETDRAWILERLPQDAKSQLSQRLNAEPAADTETLAPKPVVPERHDPVERYRKQLAGTPVEKIVALLRAEPPWLIHAFLHSAPWPWRDAVLPRLPASVRAEVLQAGQDATVLGRPAIECLLRAATEKIGAGPAHAARPSQFELLRLRFGRKVRRA